MSMLFPQATKGRQQELLATGIPFLGKPKLSTLDQSHPDNFGKVQ